MFVHPSVYLILMSGIVRSSLSGYRTCPYNQTQGHTAIVGGTATGSFTMSSIVHPSTIAISPTTNIPVNKTAATTVTQGSGAVTLKSTLALLVGLLGAILANL